MAKFIELIKENEKALVNVFGNYLFDELEREEDIFQYMKKVDKEDAKYFYCGMPEKWWEVNCSKKEDLEKDKFEKIDSDFIAEFEKFKTIFVEKDKIRKKKVMRLRETMKAGFENCGTYSDETKGVEIPPIQKEYEKDSKIIDLPEPNEDVIQKKSLFQCIKDRKSRRKFTNEKLSIAELSYLLWATQGISGTYHDGKVTTRTVPSGGARNPFETYLAINYVEGIEPGIYRYLPVDHKLVFLFKQENMIEKLIDGNLEQDFAGNCAVCFIWSTIPYRCEWRYTTESKKIIAQDSGHLCQNLYLTAESINCGTCAIGAYSQKKMDEFIEVDGVDEFVFYVSPVGKLKKEN